MKNQVINTTEAEFAKIKSTIDTNEVFLVELDGSIIQDEKTFFDQMEKMYDLRTSDGIWGRNWAAFDDLMTDLDWIPQQKHVFAVHSVNDMFLNDTETKRLFMYYFKESILPFWEEDVLYTVVEGKTKEFMVYLID